MIAIAFASLVLAGMAMIAARQRRKPEPRPVRVEAKDRKGPPRR